MLDNVKRISIIGGPGTGKSTLANNLGRELELAIYHFCLLYTSDAADE